MCLATQYLCSRHRCPSRRHDKKHPFKPSHGVKPHADHHDHPEKKKKQFKTVSKTFENKTMKKQNTKANISTTTRIFQSKSVHFVPKPANSNIYCYESNSPTATPHTSPSPSFSIPPSLPSSLPSSPPTSSHKTPCESDFFSAIINSILDRISTETSSPTTHDNITADDSVISIDDSAITDSFGDPLDTNIPTNTQSSLN